MLLYNKILLTNKARHFYLGFYNQLDLKPFRQFCVGPFGFKALEKSLIIEIYYGRKQYVVNTKIRSQKNSSSDPLDIFLYLPTIPMTIKATVHILLQRNQKQGLKIRTTKKPECTC